MSKPKRDFPYPKLTKAQKTLIYDYLCACREDFDRGRDKMIIMYKISREDWIQRNIIYFQHCMAAVDYAHSKLRLEFKKEVK